MRIIRGLAGALLWIVAALVGLVGVVLCVTLIGLPLGIPLLLLARKMFTNAVLLLLPRKVAHPISSAKESAKGAAKDAGKKTSKAGKKARKKVRFA